MEVPAGAELRVEAGTSIRGAPGSRLLVRGHLLARGTEERVVTVEPAADGPWGGLAFEAGGASASELVHALVEGADVGILIADASPRLERVRLRGCGTGLAVAGPEAQPRLVRVLAYENRGAGLTVSRLAAPLVSQSKFLKNGGPGLSFDGGGGVVFQSEVRGNGGGGVAGIAPGFRLGYSRVYGNEGFELNLGGIETAWPAVDLNYWGDPGPVEAGASVPVNRQEVTVLREPDPEAPTVALDLLALPAREGLADGLWIRRSRWMASPEARVRHERPPFVVGLEALEQGDAEAAAAALEEAVRLDRADPEAHYWLGLTRLRQGRPGPAAEALQRACLLSVKNPEYRRALAEAYLADGKRAEAELTLADLLKLDPRDEKTAAALERLRGQAR